MVLPRRLLKELNLKTPGKCSLSQIAGDDSLFLSHDPTTLVETLVRTISLPHAAYLFDLTRLLIERLETFWLKSSNTSLCSRASTEGGFEDEKFVANLEHLLRRLHGMLFEVLLRRSVLRLEESAIHWESYWEQQKKVDDGWFAEWPDGRHPLSTTMPWNIRPSLVVLWGVCWMFYDRPVKSNTPNPDNLRTAWGWPSNNTQQGTSRPLRRALLCFSPDKYKAATSQTFNSSGLGIYCQPGVIPQSMAVSYPSAASAAATDLCPGRQGYPEAGRPVRETSQSPGLASTASAAAPHRMPQQIKPPPPVLQASHPHHSPSHHPYNGVHSGESTLAVPSSSHMVSAVTLCRSRETCTVLD